MENKFTKNTGNFIKNNKGFKNIGHVATNNLNNARPQNLSDATNVTRPTMSSTDATMHSFAQSSNNNVIHNAAEQVIQNLNSSVQESATVANNIYNEQEQSNMRSSAEYRFSGNNKTTSFADEKYIVKEQADEKSDGGGNADGMLRRCRDQYSKCREAHKGGGFAGSEHHTHTGAFSDAVFRTGSGL